MAAAPFASLIRVWLDRRSDAGPPDWGAFDFADFRGWHSRLMTTVFPDDEPDPEFRIVGDAWRNMAGSNLRGRSEERRGGKEVVRTCRSRGSADPKKKKK